MPGIFGRHLASLASASRYAGKARRQAFTSGSGKKGSKGKKFRSPPQSSQVAAVPTGAGGPGGGTRPKRNSGTSPAWWAIAGVAGIASYLGGMEVAVRVMGCGDHGSEHACGGEVDVGEENRRQSYDDGAATYDKDVCSGEGWMGMTRLRKTLLGKAKGRVLEVAAGTGANFPLYPTSCEVTATDCSECMVDIARRKAEKGVALGDCGKIVVERMGVESLRYPDGHFDTVVDTFGLCSFQDPVTALKEMQRVCRKDSGQVLLLEHGRSSWSRFLSMILDRSAVGHAKKWGCWWNRDMAAIVQASGLVVVEQEQHHLGTTYLFVLRPGERDG